MSVCATTSRNWSTSSSSYPRLPKGALANRSACTSAGVSIMADTVTQTGGNYAGERRFGHTGRGCAAVGRHHRPLATDPARRRGPDRGAAFPLLGAHALSALLLGVPPHP